jgi:DNA-binding response OmpR family regulator
MSTVRMSHRILVVDDKEPLAFALSDYFLARGYEVECVSRLDTAAHKLRESSYSLVITDLRLTGMDGLEGLDIVTLVQQMHPNTRTILLTAYGSHEIELEARRRGASMVLLKPQPLSELREKIEGLLSQAVSVAAETVTGEPLSHEKPLVLVVDDEPATRELLASYLAGGHYRVAIATSAPEAVEIAMRLKPNVITLDILLRNGSGFGALYELKHLKQTAHIPIVVISAVDQKKMGLVLGASEYLVKPIHKQCLLEAIERHVKRRSGQRLHVHGGK